MTQNERLLMPRYEVIDDWPGRKDFEVGQIVVLDKQFSPEYSMHVVSDCQGERTYISKFFDQFPKQFRRLNWSEKIKYTELPLFVKWSSAPDQMSVFEVSGWCSSPNTAEIIGVYVNDTGIYGKDGMLFIYDCRPATLEEYTEYQSQTKIK